jgi:hypothetical protein
MDIVLGQRLRPNVPETPNAPETEDDAQRIEETKQWDRQHALAYQALLACLPVGQENLVCTLRAPNHFKCAQLKITADRPLE